MFKFNLMKSNFIRQKNKLVKLSFLKGRSEETRSQESAEGCQALFAPNSNQRQQVSASGVCYSASAALSEDSNDFNLNVGEEYEQVFSYLHFGMNGDKAEMEAWLSKIIAYKRDGTFEEWSNHSD